MVRSKNESAATKVIQKDLFNLTAEDLKGFDVVIDAFGAWTLETIPEIPKAVKHLCDLLKGSNARLLVVGGAGSLYTNKEHTTTLDSGADFPADGKRTGKYTLAGEELTLSSKGTSVISMQTMQLQWLMKQ
ncbi:MAG: NAD(P)-dependent oxidoreductase [Treponema sp.]